MLEPFLVAKRDQSFPDPSKFTKDEEFIYAAKISSVFKKVVGELLEQIRVWDEAVDAYKAKDEGTIEKFDI